MVGRLVALRDVGAVRERLAERCPQDMATDCTPGQLGSPMTIGQPE
ncbi:hypothetical protein [uncultured Piscinibacter sp.]|nr:hypothetical protein [uncultured Piscinibacter sp.]